MPYFGGLVSTAPEVMAPDVMAPEVMAPDVMAPDVIVIAPDDGVL